jgi:hypothetical protein
MFRILLDVGIHALVSGRVFLYLDFGAAQQWDHGGHGAQSNGDAAIRRVEHVIQPAIFLVP